MLTWNSAEIKQSWRSWHAQEANHSPFKLQEDKERFFRPGQVFALQISSYFEFHNERSWRPVNCSRLPLDPISKLQKEADLEATEDRQKRRAQLLELPLRKMIPYSIENPVDHSKVYCRLCWRLNEEPSLESHRWMAKDEWASWHFRFYHWGEYYREMAGVSKLDKRRNKDRQPSSPDFPELEAEFQIDAWIRLEDVACDEPLASDTDMQRLIYTSPMDTHGPRGKGPALIRRFSVVRSGDECSLCIGIHT